ncbi:MAG: altronate dehydratase [Planctomycetales bacterium]|nr:altronate dehydratase [Planctomycetales bacterium]
MHRRFLLVHPDDDMIVALTDLEEGISIELDGRKLALRTAVAAKHKFARRAFAAGELMRMYGVTVARAVVEIAAGEALTTENVVHATDDVETGREAAPWTPPDWERFRDSEFLGFSRDDGRVGTRNFWIVIPLVFCENRNLRVMQEAMLEELGYARDQSYRPHTRRLIERLRQGATREQILSEPFQGPAAMARADRVFENVDGVKFLTHQQGCGGNYEDAVDLCGLLAGYIDHPNVAGATVLSLGCQKAQIQTLEEQLQQRNSNFCKPLYIFEQQRLGTEETIVSEAIKHTFAGLITANRARREPAGLKQLCVGVECGGSDGFSGISANPAIGHCSDLVVAAGGAVILSEFPELAGCEQDLADRCCEAVVADRFLHLMKDYSEKVAYVGAGFDSNPSPGNIRDGLITDAIKSAGAARKGGTSPVSDVLDYPEQHRRPGLNLLCTPGGDVESTTAKTAAGANLTLFSTGLGTPTGNPICPVIKISSNTPLAERMPDIIDLDTGPVIAGEETIEQAGERILELVIATASGQSTCAERLGQDDFIPWKRGLSF